MRRIGIVAVARRLLIDLWRHVETGVILTDTRRATPARPAYSSVPVTTVSTRTVPWHPSWSVPGWNGMPFAL
jgi:hypothetical protein